MSERVTDCESEHENAEMVSRNLDECATDQDGDKSGGDSSDRVAHIEIIDH